MTDRRAEIVRWARGHRAAERRAASLRRAPTPADALEQALELWDLRPELFDHAPDPIRLREVAEARVAWARLRRRCREHRKA